MINYDNPTERICSDCSHSKAEKDVYIGPFEMVSLKSIAHMYTDLYPGTGDYIWNILDFANRNGYLTPSHIEDLKSVGISSSSYYAAPYRYRNTKFVSTD